MNKTASRLLSFSASQKRDAMNRVCTAMLCLIIGLSFFSFAPLAKADSFTISGTLEATDPLQNSYGAAYRLVTPSGSKFYLKLKDVPYSDWLMKECYFHAEGDYDNFVISSSGLGKRDNTVTPPSIPSTGAGLYLALALALASGVLIMSRKKFKQLAYNFLKFLEFHKMINNK